MDSGAGNVEKLCIGVYFFFAINFCSLLHLGVSLEYFDIYYATVIQRFCPRM